MMGCLIMDTVDLEDTQEYYIVSDDHLRRHTVYYIVRMRKAQTNPGSVDILEYVLKVIFRARCS